MPKKNTISTKLKSKAAKKIIFSAVLKGRKQPFYLVGNSNYMVRHTKIISYLHSLVENEISLMIATSSRVAASGNS